MSFFLVFPQLQTPALEFLYSHVQTSYNSIFKGGTQTQSLFGYGEDCHWGCIFYSNLIYSVSSLIKWRQRVTRDRFSECDRLEKRVGAVQIIIHDYMIVCFGKLRIVDLNKCGF